MLYNLDRRQFIFSKDVKFSESIFPFKDSVIEKADITTNIFQELNHINFFDSEYPEIPNDDERVDPSLNSDQRSQSDNSHSSVPGGSVNTADFPSGNSRNDAQSSDDIFPAQDEQLNKNSEPKTFYEVSKYSQWTDAMNNEMDELTKLPKDRKAIEGVDYEKTFSPVVKMVTVRCLLNLDASSCWSVFQLDVNNAFLYGDLVENSDKGVFLALIVYVNDIIITGNSISEIEKFRVFLKSKFMIKDLGKVKYFLGIEVIDTDKGICLNQRKYVLNLLSEYGMLACKPAKTPLMSKLAISNEATDTNPLLDNITDYQKLMEKLIYLTNTRTNISYVVHCSLGLGVHIVKDSGMSLKAYSDAHWAKCVVTRKSVTGYYVFLNGSLIS
ncbi:ribonuclease H-like domain-containing protein [Tanacetum coccineum]